MPLEVLNGEQMYYEVHGTGTPIVFAHGAGGNHAFWWQQVPFFRQHGYQCITIDQRGYGQSGGTPGNPDDMTKDVYADDLVALLDRLGLQKAIFCGTSLGSRTITGIALRYPQRVIAMVYSGGAGGFHTEASRQHARQMLEHLAKGGQRGASVSSHFEQDQPASAFLFRQFHDMTPGRGPRLAGNPATYQRNAERPAGDYSNYQVPSLFILGAEDAMAPPSVVKAVAAAIPGAKYVEIAGSGHAVPWEKPAEFNRAVLEFLEGVKARA